MKTIYRNSKVYYELETEKIIKLINRLHEENPDSLLGYTIDINALQPIHFKAASYYFEHVPFNTYDNLENVEDDLYRQFCLAPFDALGLPVNAEGYVLDPVDGEYLVEGMMMREWLKNQIMTECCEEFDEDEYEEDYHFNWFY